VPDDLIPVLGTPVSVAEVEAQMRDHPSVAEAAVIGLPDAFTGFALKAFVCLDPSIQATPKELVAFCRQRMPAHVYPRHVEIVEALPRTASGEIDRGRLGDLELSRMRKSGSSPHAPHGSRD
jgi:acyl-coenzyme A synthetase/AMP-(fatty) acid ligase